MTFTCKRCYKAELEWVEPYKQGDRPILVSTGKVHDCSNPKLSMGTSEFKVPDAREFFCHIDNTPLDYWCKTCNGFVNVVNAK